MNYLKKIGITLIIILSIILALTLIITILYYFNLIGDKTLCIFEIIIPILSLFYGGLHIGKKSKKKGYMEGLKLGIIISLFLIIFNFLAFSNSFKLKYLLFYTILNISSILGSMIGINKYIEKN